jgi:dTDP-4-dehydrorhamnose reductase
MINILITGSNGQLGSEIGSLVLKYPEYAMTFTDVGELDITNNMALEDFVSNKDFDLILNCAAYTAVDKAESEQELAANVNTLAVRNLAEICQARQIMLIHISTDYVFDGTSHLPYAEDHPTNPIGVYAKTKWEGEEAIRRTCSRSVIIRTSWLYSFYGHNFVKTILRLSQEKDRLNVVFDQIGSPTYAHDLARLLLDHIPAFLETENNELFHYANEGVASWYDFARAIVEWSGSKCRVYPVTSAEYPTPAARPNYSVFNKNHIKKTLRLEIPYWRESLIHCLEKIRNSELNNTK